MVKLKTGPWKLYVARAAPVDCGTVAEASWNIGYRGPPPGTGEFMVILGTEIRGNK